MALKIRDAKVLFICANCRDSLRAQAMVRDFLRRAPDIKQESNEQVDALWKLIVAENERSSPYAWNLRWRVHSHLADIFTAVDVTNRFIKTNTQISP